tara:strand:- start:289 stop:825 length:537 start_codon:yes stop_codon:yes gene_type:complete
MNNQEIIDNAPEGATHFDTEYGFYWMMDRERSQAFSHSANKFEWDTLSSDFLRSLEDIKRIAELEKERDMLKEENTSLQAYAFRVIAFVTRSVAKLRNIPEFKPTGDVLNRVLRLTPNIALGAHNLKQQANGIMDFKKWVLDTDQNSSDLDVRDINLIEFYVEPLISQAKALEEQGDE